MNAPAHISSVLDSMLKACPLCKAKPLEPCYNVYSLLKAPVRYTHAERNR